MPIATPAKGKPQVQIRAVRSLLAAVLTIVACVLRRAETAASFPPAMMMIRSAVFLLA